MAGFYRAGVKGARQSSRSAVVADRWLKPRSQWDALVSAWLSTVRFTFRAYIFVLEYQFEQSARRLKHVYETAMKESQEPGMDYNKYVFISFI